MIHQCEVNPACNMRDRKTGCKCNNACSFRQMGKIEKPLKKKKQSPVEDKVKILPFCVTLDCRNAEKLAKFYADLLDWESGYRSYRFHWAAPKGGGFYPFLAFQEDPHYTSPVWPREHRCQQVQEHLDFAVTDIDKAIEKAVSLGAVVAEYQVASSWTVMIDPEGHPFCLSQKTTIFEIMKKRRDS